MKSIAALFSLFILAAFAAIPLKAVSAQEGDRTIIRLTNGEWPPYSSEYLPHYGFFSRVVSEAFRINGYQVEYAFYPWKRAYELAAKGAFDGSVTWAPTPERQQDFRFSDPVIESKKVFFHLKNHPFHWQTLEDLTAYRIGVTSGYTYGRKFDEAWKTGDLNIQEVTSDAQNIRKLLLKRIDTFPMEIAVGYALIRDFLPPGGTRAITHAPKPIVVTPIAVAISRQLPPKRIDAILHSLNRGLKTLRQQGVYDRYKKEMLHITATPTH